MPGAGAKRREERVKLAATALSNLGLASIVTGVIAPLLAGRAQLIGIVVSFIVGATLHLAAQIVLSSVANPRVEMNDEHG